MKALILKVTLLTVLWSLCLGIFAQRSSFDSDKPIGWGEATTGGGAVTNSNYVVVTSESELINAFKSDYSHIFIKGKVTVSTHISATFSNKTIWGLPGSFLYSEKQDKDNSGILYFSKCSNVIMRNVTFKSVGAYDTDGWDNFCMDGCTKVWIDHCDFQDGVDGNFDIKNGSDNVSVSWCRFRYLLPPKAGGPGGSDDHRYTNLIGSSDGKTSDAGKLNVTFQLCWWDEGCKERMPRVRYGKVHVLNCMYSSSVTSYCVGGGIKSSVLVENSAFYNIKASKGPYSKITSGAAATFKGSYYDASCKSYTDAEMNKRADASAFTPSYKYPVYDANKIKAEIENQSNGGAGATLNVKEGVGIVGGAVVNPDPEPLLDLTLKSITVNGSQVTLKETDTYSVELPEDVENCEIKAEANSSDASVSIDKNNVSSFPSTIKITVSNAPESKVYTLILTRKEKDVTAPSLIATSVKDSAVVKPTSSVSFTFDEEIVGDDISVIISGNAAEFTVSGTVLTVSLNLAQPEDLIVYEIVVTGVKDASGNDAGEQKISVTVKPVVAGSTATWIVGDVQYWESNPTIGVELQDTTHVVASTDGTAEVMYEAGVGSKIQKESSGAVSGYEDTYEYGLNSGGSASAKNKRFFTIPINGSKGTLTVVYKMYSSTNLATMAISEELWKTDSKAVTYEMKTTDEGKALTLSYDVTAEGVDNLYVYSLNKKCYTYAIYWEREQTSTDAKTEGSANSLKVVNVDGGLLISADKNESVVIYDVLGNVVKRLDLNDETVNVMLPKGFYVVNEIKVVVR